MKSMIGLTFVLAMLVACGKKSEQPPPATGSGSSAMATGSGSGSETAAGSGSGSGSAVAADEPLDLPTAMDYEELAAEDITEATVEARLKELESQLADQ